MLMGMLWIMLTEDHKKLCMMQNSLIQELTTLLFLLLFPSPFERKNKSRKKISSKIMMENYQPIS